MRMRKSLALSKIPLFEDWQPCQKCARLHPLDGNLCAYHKKMLYEQEEILFYKVIMEEKVKKYF